MFAAGSGIGLLSAVLGAGGGFITVPFLVRRNVTMQQAVASSAACGFPIALAGTLGYIWAGRHLELPSGTIGYLYLPALAIISLASVITAPPTRSPRHRSSGSSPACFWRWRFTCSCARFRADRSRILQTRLSRMTRVAQVEYCFLSSFF
jgi:hypothetical protein